MDEDFSHKMRQEVEMIIHYRSHILREGQRFTLDQAGETFIDKYAVKYASIWYDGISNTELKEKLFGYNSRGEYGN